MLTAIRLALSDIASPVFRSVMLKSLSLTLLLLFALWAVLEALLGWAIDIKAYPWLNTVISIITGVGLLIGLAFLVAPVTSLFTGLFSDSIARAIEQVHYPHDPPGQDLPLSEAIRDAVAFTALLILVNLIALLLLLVPVVNAFAFLAGNGYLLGRASFETAARRYLSREDSQKMRVANGGRVFLGGLVIAAIATVPLLNVITPLFATAFMLHFYKRIIRPAPPAPGAAWA
jgi:CysZ protein